MCDPMTIGGLVLSGASAGLNMMADGESEKARKGALEAERIRQRGYDQETNALNAASQDRYKTFNEDQDKKATELGDYFKAQNQPLPTESGGAAEPSVPTSASNIVVREQAKQQGRVKQFSDQQAGALGNLRAFGDLLGDVSLLQGRDASQIGTIGGFKRGSQSVLPLELEAANNKGSGKRMFADLLGLGGTVVGGMGNAGTFASGGPTLFSTPLMGPFKPGMATRTPTALGRMFDMTMPRAGVGYGL